MFFTSNVWCVVWGYYSLKLQGKQYKQKRLAKKLQKLKSKLSLTLGSLNKRLSAVMPPPEPFCFQLGDWMLFIQIIANLQISDFCL